MVKFRLDKIIIISLVVFAAAIILILDNESGVKADPGAYSELQAAGAEGYQDEMLQLQNTAANQLPAWVTKLGVGTPEGLRFDAQRSYITSKENPAEGFNSVSLVYYGSYEKAAAEAARLASLAKLPAARSFVAKGSPLEQNPAGSRQFVKYANYGLETINEPFLVSIQVEPSGKLTLMVTDNKQLNECLTAYEPMIMREKNASKRKKQ